MAWTPLPAGTSAFLEPGDAPYLLVLEACARARRRLGLPSLTLAELAALLESELRERRAPLPHNVVRFPGVRGRRADDPPRR